MENFKSGFVNIIGLPNVGKSSLINYLINDHLSIVNSKAQTTRHSIRGFVNTESYQAILVDTPGWIESPAYQLQMEMNKIVNLAFEEGDILLLVVDKFNRYEANHHLIQSLLKSMANIIVVLNKIDLCNPEEVEKIYLHYQQLLPNSDFQPISVIAKFGKKELLQKIETLLPVHPPYFDSDEWTDRNARFFASEIIRERIFTHFHKEIPYSCEVVIEKYKERPEDVLIEAIIFVERESQRNIVIGENGQKIKQIGKESREAIGKFLDQKVHLFLNVKVLENWRNRENILKRFGYSE